MAHTVPTQKVSTRLRELAPAAREPRRGNTQPYLHLLAKYCTCRLMLWIEICGCLRCAHRAPRKNGNLSSSSVNIFSPLRSSSFPFLSLLLQRLVACLVVLHSGGDGGKTALVRDESVLPLLNRGAIGNVDMFHHTIHCHRRRRRRRCRMRTRVSTSMYRYSSV